MHPPLGHSGKREAGCVSPPPPPMSQTSGACCWASLLSLQDCPQAARGSLYAAAASCCTVFYGLLLLPFYQAPRRLVGDEAWESCSSTREIPARGYRWQTSTGFYCVQLHSTCSMADSTSSNKREASPEAAQSDAKRVRVEPEQQQLDPESLAYRLAQYSDKSASAESLVGISGYVNPDLPPFSSAIIKHRFTDFLVWEMDRQGQVVRLKDISRPVTVIPDEEKQQDTPAKEEEEAPRIDLQDFMTQDKIQELQAFVEQGKQEGKTEMFSDVCSILLHSLRNAVHASCLWSPFQLYIHILTYCSSLDITLQPIEDKERRKAFHNAIRTLYEGKLSTEAGEKGVIKITWATGGGRGESKLCLSFSNILLSPLLPALCILHFLPSFFPSVIFCVLTPPLLAYHHLLLPACGSSTLLL